MTGQAENVLIRAADLFNRRLYFECHDLLEDAWARERGEDRDFLQGLIHMAVGMYHLAAGNFTGASSQLRKALNRLEAYQPEHRGLDVALLTAASEQCLGKALEGGNGVRVEFRASDVPRMRFRECAQPGLAEGRSA